MTAHDPLQFASSFSAKLATRSRHVCAFLGAGVARACGLPDIAGLEKLVLGKLSEDQKAAFTKQLAGRNIEQALSRLRRIAALLSSTEKIDEMTAAQATELDKAVCQAIVSALDIAGKDLVPMNRFAAWVARTDYRLPVELFTVNYDLLLETALEELRVPYFDGFIGSLRARFHTELVEGIPGQDEQWVPSSFARLWKLHGSVNWSWEGKQHVVRLGAPVGAQHVAAIYPSDSKYEESRRVPFVVLQDRFRRALHQPETLVIISGYSFNDDHLNELIFDAATRRERSEFVVFCFAEIPKALAERAATTPNLQVVGEKEAILGGVRAPWKATDDVPEKLWKDGKFLLGDFRHLAGYLAMSAVKEPEHDPFMRKLLEIEGAKNVTATSTKNG